MSTGSRKKRRAIPAKNKNVYRWKKKVRNSPLVKEKDRREFKKIFVLLWFTVLVGGMLLLLVWQRFRPVFTNYEIQELVTEKKALLEEQRKLRCYKEQLRTLERIETSARSDLRMKLAEPSQVVYVRLKKTTGNRDGTGKLIASLNR